MERKIIFKVFLVFKRPRKYNETIPRKYVTTESWFKGLKYKIEAVYKNEQIAIDSNLYGKIIR